LSKHLGAFNIVNTRISGFNQDFGFINGPSDFTNILFFSSLNTASSSCTYLNVLLTYLNKDIVSNLFLVFIFVLKDE
jgi:hypothetical protein